MDEAELLLRLVGKYSPSGREQAAVREFVRCARTLGYLARTDAAGNGIAMRGTGRPRIVFLGHIDTVSGRLPVRVRSGRVFGRGAVDAKGPLAAALWAGRELPGAGEYLVIAAVGEETDSRGARYLTHRLQPDAVIAGEPGRWDGVTIGYKGELQIVRTFRGHRTHYSSPAPTAADRVVDWLSALRAFVASRQTDSPYRSLSAKVLELASRRDGDLETAQATVDFRLPPGLSTEELERALPTPSDRTRCAVKVRVEPLELDRNNAAVSALIAGVRSLGGQPTLWRKAGTSDLNLVLPSWGVPGAVYGPGNPHLDHTDRESISVTEVRRAAQVLRFALERLREPGRLALAPRDASRPNSVSD